MLRTRMVYVVACSGAAWMIIAPETAAQCIPHWSDEFAASDFSSAATRLQVVNLPSVGPRLFSMGFARAFPAQTPASGGAVPPVYWTGDHWASFGAGMPNTRAVAVFDDGGGPTLFAAGEFGWFHGIARWSGEGWELYPGPSWGSDLASFGGKLFATAGGRLFHLDGRSWELVPGSPPSGASVLYADDVAGALYVAGSFTSGFGVGAQRIAKWDGAQWSALGAGISAAPSSTIGSVYTMISADLGSGPRLYVGGAFSHAGNLHTPGLAIWDGSAWHIGGLNLYPVESLAVLDVGHERHLYAAPNEPGAAPLFRLRIVGGQLQWQGLPESFTASSISTLATFNDGSGEKLYIGGQFRRIGDVPAGNIAAWDGHQWSSLRAGGALGEHRLDVLPWAEGAALFASGPQLGGIGTAAGHVLQRSHNAWLQFSPELSPHEQWRFVSFDPGAVGAPMLIAISRTQVRRWTGSHWVLIPDAPSGLWFGTVFDDGVAPALYAVRTEQNLSAIDIIRWDGQTWTSIGNVQSTSFCGRFVGTMTVLDDGTGPALYIAGDFTHVDSVPALRIARWTGAEWQSLGEGVGPTPPLPGSSGSCHRLYTLAAYHDSAGAALYAGGLFFEAGGLPARGLARWNGTSWSPVPPPDPAPTSFSALATFDDGAVGPRLYAAPVWSGAQPESRLLRWDGAQWEFVEDGPDGTVRSLAVLEDVHGTSLWMSGSFRSAGGHHSNLIARYMACAPCYPNCDGSTVNPILNVDDFTCFINAFASALQLSHAQQLTHYANCDGSSVAPVLNVDDFTCFINAFASGCP